MIVKAEEQHLFSLTVILKVDFAVGARVVVQLADW